MEHRLWQVEEVWRPEVTEADIAVSPAWRELQGVIAHALLPYPEATQALVAAGQDSARTA